MVLEKGTPGLSFGKKEKKVRHFPWGECRTEMSSSAEHEASLVGWEQLTSLAYSFPSHIQFW